MPSGFSSLDQELGWSSFGEHWDIVGVEFGHSTDWQLRLLIEALDEKEIWVAFNNPVSFRVHDEGEIYPYWVDRAKEAASISDAYTIANSAYLQELTNGVTAQAVGPLTHYLIGGQNTCVEVLSRSPPELLPGPPRAK